MSRKIIDMGVVVVLGLLQCFAALVLAVTLYAITPEQDPDAGPGLPGRRGRWGRTCWGATSPSPHPSSPRAARFSAGYS